MEVDVPEGEYPISAYRKVQYASVMNVIGGIFIILLYPLLLIATSPSLWMVFLLIPAIGAYAIIMGVMLKKAGKLIMSGDYYLIHKGGKMAVIYGILSLSYFAFIGGTEAMDFGTKHYTDENYDPYQNEIDKVEFLIRRG